MMEDGRSLVAFLLFISIVVRGVVAVEYIATGKEFKFLSKMTAKLENIEWKHNGDLVVDWDPANDVTWYRYKERAELDIITGDLTLRQLKPEDSGVFKGQFQVAGFLKYAEHTIKVIYPVSKPVVTCVKNATDITLTCKLDPQVQANFKWEGPNGFTSDGPKVQISNKETSTIFFCTASNEVSKSETEFNIEKCPKAEESNDFKGGEIAGGIVGGILLLILAAGGGYVAWKKKDVLFQNSPSPKRDAGKSEQSDQLTNLTGGVKDAHNPL